jgi:hypothetical protein
LVLVNGGAVVGILTFIGNMWAKDSALAHNMAERMVLALGLFTFALLLSVVSAFLSYLSALGFAQALTGLRGQIRRARKSKLIRITAVICAAVSLAFFAIGAVLAIRAFQDA